MLKGWKKITKTNLTEFKLFNKDLQQVEYFNSFIYQVYSRMIYKKVNSKLVIAKASAIMGTYSIIKFFGNETLNTNFLSNGFTLRGHNIDGRKDKFGNEYIYDANECERLEGSKYKRFRKVLSRYKDNVRCECGYNEDVDKVVLKYPKHQQKLLNVIKQFLPIVQILRIYYNNEILGFSIV